MDASPSSRSWPSSAAPQPAWYASHGPLLLSCTMLFILYAMDSLWSYYDHPLSFACAMQLLGYDNGECPLPMCIQQNPTNAFSEKKTSVSAA